MSNISASAQFVILKNHLEKRTEVSFSGRKRVTYKNVEWFLQNATRLVFPPKIKKILRACHKKDRKYEAFNDPIYQHSLVVKDKKCEKLQEAYAARGITIQTGSYDPRIYKVKLTCFSAAEWVDIINKDGGILGVCCSLISHVRDKLINAARDDYYVDSFELCEIVDNLKEHTCGHLSEPLSRLETLWNQIKDDARLHVGGFTVNPTELQDAVSVLARASEVLVWNKLVTESGEDRVYHQKMDRVCQLAKVLPAVRTVYEHLLNCDIPDVDGWAVCDGDEVYMTGLGLSVYRSKERAEYWRDLINKHPNYGKKQRHPELSIRPVRVTVRRGILFMDTEASKSETPHNPPPLQMETDEDA
jgi:hypothetical protein